MTARDFDPVLAAALRNELEALADGAHDAPAPRPALHPVLRRPQVWITVVTAVVLTVATLGVLQLTAVRATPPATRVTGAAIADPLAQSMDPEYPDYAGPDVRALLQRSGTGPTSIPITIPTGVTSVRPLVRCAPTADFRVTVEGWYATGCTATTSTGWGDIPVTSGQRHVVLQIPAGVSWRLAVIETPGTTTASTLRVTQPADAAR